MSIHYLLDGYNVIHKMPAVLDLGKLEDRRWELIRFLERARPQGSPNNRITVVFDGDVRMSGGMVSPAVKVVFSLGEDADETIKRIVAQAGNPKVLTVVSDDRSIQYAVRAQGAKVLTVKTFLAQAKDPGADRRGSPMSTTKAGPSKAIPKSEEDRITTELGKIWLDPEKKRKKR